MKILLGSLLFLTIGVYGQTSKIFKKKQVPVSLASSYFNSNFNNDVSLDVYVIKSTELRDKDAALYIEQVLRKKHKILLPDIPILISKNGLKVPSNSTIYFGKGTVLKFIGPARGRFSDIIKLYDVSNVKIYNAQIEGSRNFNNNQTGEWSAGIAILNSRNIVIKNAYIYNTWGDGIFIGSENNGVSTDIVLDKIWIDNARRNAISVTSAINADLNNILVSNTNGVSPECGVDIEPSLFGEFLQNINFNNFYSFNNRVAFNINLSVFNSDKQQYKPKVSLNLNNFYDNYSQIFIGMGLNNFSKKFSAEGDIVIKNGITYSDKHDVRLDISKMRTRMNLKNENIRKK
ncbi:MAG TPA: hypothetical protein DCW66_08025 [Sphingobacterium sp.]|uniref:hypothetical protein n=1 Tax=Sphingobacterium multivorum TaxID=28454 RepID=UPI000E96D961|nr:hypothetical protein [Sphingobacterium multivorum]HAU53116.1 hypothetical protein [Sphingobacterium sp.]